MNANYHGKDGDLALPFPTKFKTPFVDDFVAACAAVGIPENKDYNGAQQESAEAIQSTIKEGNST